MSTPLGETQNHYQGCHVKQLAKHLLKHVILLLFLTISQVSPQLSRQSLESSSAPANVTSVRFVAGMIVVVMVVNNKNRATSKRYLVLHFIWFMFLVVDVVV